MLKASNVLKHVRFEVALSKLFQLFWCYGCLLNIRLVTPLSLAIKSIYVYFFPIYVRFYFSKFQILVYSARVADANFSRKFHKRYDKITNICINKSVFLYTIAHLTQSTRTINILQTDTPSVFYINSRLIKDNVIGKRLL